VYVFGGRELGRKVVDDRCTMAAHGVAHATVPVGADGALAGHVVVVSRGVVDEEVDGELLRDAGREAAAAVAELSERTDQAIVDTARQAVRRIFGRALGFKPVTMVTVVRVKR
jgi:mRNA degradation ribonuclease J1/J2